MCAVGTMSGPHTLRGLCKTCATIGVDGIQMEMQLVLMQGGMVIHFGCWTCVSHWTGSAGC